MGHCGRCRCRRDHRRDCRLSASFRVFVDECNGLLLFAAEHNVGLPDDRAPNDHLDVDIDLDHDCRRIGQSRGSKINFLLAESSNDRNEIVSRHQQISNCGNLSQDESFLNSAAQSRQLLINELPKLQIAQVPGGAQLIAA